MRWPGRTHGRGLGYAQRGRTPLVRVCHKRASLSLISAVANWDELRWMIVDGAVKAPTLIRFLERLIREARRKVFLILDRLRVHRARLVQDWLAEHGSSIEKWRPWCMLNPFRAAGSASGVLTALA